MSALSAIKEQLWEHLYPELSYYPPLKLSSLKNLEKKNLINNGFPNYIVDTEIKLFINKPEQHSLDYIINHKKSIIPDIGLGVRVFANGPGDLGSIQGRVIPKTQKMALDASLLNTQHYKVRIKGKVEQSRERISALPYTTV